MGIAKDRLPDRAAMFFLPNEFVRKLLPYISYNEYTPLTNHELNRPLVAIIRSGLDKPLKDMKRNFPKDPVNLQFMLFMIGGSYGPEYDSLLTGVKNYGYTAHRFVIHMRTEDVYPKCRPILQNAGVSINTEPTRKLNPFDANTITFNTAPTRMDRKYDMGFTRLYVDFISKVPYGSIWSVI